MARHASFRQDALLSRFRALFLDRIVGWHAHEILFLDVESTGVVGEVHDEEERVSQASNSHDWVAGAQPQDALSRLVRAIAQVAVVVAFVVPA